MAGPYGTEIPAGTPRYTNSNAVTGTDDGILAHNDANDTHITLTNNGSATGTNGYGIDVEGGGTVTNNSNISGASGVSIHEDGIVTNNHMIRATAGFGVTISDGGTVTNGAGDIIRTSAGGVAISGKAGTVTNDGQITASAASSVGVSLARGGTVTNNAAGTIIGGSDGVSIAQGDNTAPPTIVTNSGRITGTAGTGVAIADAGTVTNTSVITGANGVSISGKGTVTNSMRITATAGTGVTIAGGGKVSNAKGSSITSTQGGIDISGGAGTVTNTGTISATTASSTGVSLDSGGVITNGIGATITGGANGIEAGAGNLGVSPTLVTNAGTITGTDGTGVSIAGPGVVTNIVTITGANGVSIDKAGTVTNAHKIEATGGTGVSIDGGGTVTNSPLATISGTEGGVGIDNLPGVVTNAGTISASSASSTGVDLGAGGVVVNAALAKITGGANGISTDAGPLGNSATSVTNAGTITGTDGTGVAIGGPGTINNSGTITGAEGVSIDQKGKVTNTDTIKATSGTAVEIDGGGSVSNGGKDSITGTAGGVVIGGGAGTVTNGGTISASAASATGVTLESGGSIDNEAGATIKGGSQGILTEGGDDGSAQTTLANAGTISSIDGTAVSIAGGGTVANLGSITGAGGVSIGAAGVVANSATITATQGIAVSIAGIGDLVNATGASLTGVGGGLSIGGVATVTNDGSISASSASGSGMQLAAGGTVDNAKGATISGDSYGLLCGGGPDGSSTATIEDDGTISGSTAISITGAGIVVDAGAIKSTRGNTGTAVAFGATGSTFVLDRGATLVGGISGFDGGDALEFGVSGPVNGYTTTTGPSGMTTLTLTENGAGVVSLDLVGNFVGDAFTLHALPGSQLVSVTLGGPSTTVSTATFDKSRTSLDKRSGGFAIADTAANIEKDLPNLEADASHINSIAATDHPVSVDVEMLEDDQDALDKVLGGVDLTDTASAIKANLAEIDADIGHIASITLGSGTLDISAAMLEGSRPALDEIGSFAITDTAANLQKGLASIEADIADIGAIAVTTGTLTVSIATFERDNAALNKVGTFAVLDSATHVLQALPRLEADSSRINAIKTTDGPVAASVSVFTEDQTVLDKIVTGFDVHDSAAEESTYFNALKADVAHIKSLSFSDTSTPVLTLRSGQASDDAALLAKISQPYVLVVAATDGATTTTGHGDGLTIAAAPAGNDRIDGGGTNETFVFDKSFGHDTLADLYQHLTGTAQDTVVLPKSEFADFAAVLHDASTTSAGTTLTVQSNGDRLFLSHVTASELKEAQGDFKFA